MPKKHLEGNNVIDYGYMRDTKSGYMTIFRFDQVAAMFRDDDQPGSVMVRFIGAADVINMNVSAEHATKIMELYADFLARGGNRA